MAPVVIQHSTAGRIYVNDPAMAWAFLSSLARAPDKIEILAAAPSPESTADNSSTAEIDGDHDRAEGIDAEIDIDSVRDESSPIVQDITGTVDEVSPHSPAESPKSRHRWKPSCMTPNLP